MDGRFNRRPSHLHVILSLFYGIQASRYCKIALVKSALLLGPSLQLSVAISFHYLTTFMSQPKFFTYLFKTGDSRPKGGLTNIDYRLEQPIMRQPIMRKLILKVNKKKISYLSENHF